MNISLLIACAALLVLWQITAQRLRAALHRNKAFKRRASFWRSRYYSLEDKVYSREIKHRIKCEMLEESIRIREDVK